MEKNVASLQELMLRRKSLVLLDRLDTPTEDVMNINDKHGYMEFLTHQDLHRMKAMPVRLLFLHRR